MSKDNMLLGYARGKVGSLVFARRKGLQITRAYNANPANPRTPGQIYQRMKMYAPTLLYKKVRARFFPFAFEDQRPNETPYNAFMRHNIAVAPWVSKTLASEYAPVPFRAVMSEGSLSVPSFDFGSLDNAQGGTAGVAVYFPLTDQVDTETIGGISADFVKQGFQVGDLITFVGFKSAGLSVEQGNVLYDGVSALQFKYAQMVVNPADETPFEEVGLAGLRDGAVGAPSSFGLIIDETEQDETSYGGCIIVTRKSGEKVLVSSSVLSLNDYAANTILSTMSGVLYRDTFAAPTYGVNSPDYLNPSKEI